MSERYLSPRQSQANRERRLQQAASDFLAAHRLASANGMTLTRFTPVHYALVHIAKQWRKDIYPSNQHIYADPHRRGPFLRVPDDEWTLMDVVTAAIAAEKERLV